VGDFFGCGSAGVEVGILQGYSRKVGVTTWFFGGEIVVFCMVIVVL
jgi:hypothetical protein